MKKATLGIVLGLLLLELMLSATPAVAADGELRDLRGFNAITVGGGIDLEVRQGAEFRVEVTASNGEHGNVLTEIRDSTLVIRTRSGSGLFNWFTEYTVAVTLPELVSLAASGGSDASVAGPVTGEKLSVVASGGSDIELAIAVAELEAVASGGSDLSISGTAGTIRINASGGSDVDARELRSRQAEVDASGGSDTVLAVSERLVAHASGGSDIVYFGDPATADVQASGGAEVTRR